MKTILWILKDIPCSGGFTAGNLRLYNLLNYLSKTNKYKLVVRGNQANYGLGDLQRLNIDTSFNQSINHVITKDIQPDVIIVSWCGILSTYYNHLKLLFPNIPIICDTVDVAFTRLQDELGSNNPLFIKEKNKEIQTYKNSDRVLVVSESDQNKLKEYNIDSDIVSCCYQYSDNIITNCDNIEKDSVSFQGFFLHKPNVSAALKSIQMFKEVLKKKPNAHLYIVGKHVPNNIIDFSKKVKNVNVTGVVYNFDKFMSRIEVCIAPILYGSGQNGKILDSMSRNIPIVTSTIGAKGIKQLVSGENCFIHNIDNTEAFVDSIIKLFNDKKLKLRLINNARQVIKENYSIEIVGQQLVNILNQF